MVKVLPEPVTPSSTCVRSCAVDALDEILDRRRLVAGRLEIATIMTIGDAAFGFFRAGRAVRRPQLAVLVQRVAALDQRRQRRDGRGDARNCPSSSASSSAMSRPATGLRPAAARSRAVAAPPIEVPRAVLVGAEERSGIFFGFGLAMRWGALGLPRDLLGPVGDRALERRAGEFGLRRFAKSPWAAAARRRRGIRSAGCGADVRTRPPAAGMISRGIWPCRKYGACRGTMERADVDVGPGRGRLLTQGCQERGAFRLDRQHA